MSNKNSEDSFDHLTNGLKSLITQNYSLISSPEDTPLLLMKKLPFQKKSLNYEKFKSLTGSEKFRKTSNLSAFEKYNDLGNFIINI
jgi:hypothetical protein